MVDLDDVKVEKKQGGSIKDSSLVDGIILDKERVHSGMPRSVDEAKITLVNSAIEVKRPKSMRRYRLPTHLCFPNFWKKRIIHQRAR